MSFGLTSDGLSIKRLADIIADLEADARVTFGSTVDLDARRPLGQFLGIQAERQSMIWELIEAVYNASFPRYAEGKQLDEIVVFNGLIRRAATFSKVGIVVYGDLGTVVTAGSQASVLGAPESIFEIDEDITIGAGTSEIQLLTFLSVPIGGSFTLVIESEATAGIPYNATAASIKAALDALTVVDTVTVTGNWSVGFTVTFTGSSAQRPWAPLTVGSNVLTSRTVNKVTCVADVGGSLHVKSFRFADSGGSVGVYFDIGNAGAPAPAGLVAVTYRQIKVSTVISGATASAVATGLAAALAADGVILSAIAATNIVTFTLLATKNLQGLIDLNTAFTFETTNVGRDIGELLMTSTEMAIGTLPNGIGSATAITAGSIPANAGTLTVLEDSIEGWDAISNPLDAVQGKTIETDAELQARRIDQFARGGRCTPSAIKAKLLLVTDVTQAAVRYNNTIATVDGIPPKSVKAYVQGGLNADIAAMLFDTVAAGILTVGAVSVAHIDEDNFSHTISFSRPTVVPIYVDVTIELIDEDDWPADGDATIEDAIIEYGASLKMGDDVVPYPKLMAYLNILDYVVEGIRIKVGTSASPTLDARIVIGSEQMATFDTSRITITLDEI